MSFHDTLFPACFEPFLVAKSTFSTSKVICASGREIRSSDLPYSRNLYELKDCYVSEFDFMIFNNFFKARRGSRFSFKLRDFADYCAKNQVIGVGDGVKKNFPLQKSYSDESYEFIKKITKINRDSLKVFIDGKENSLWKINENSGIIETAIPIEKGLTLSADFEFYTPVRFAEDNLNYERKSDGTIEILNITLIEVIE